MMVERKHERLLNSPPFEKRFPAIYPCKSLLPLFVVICINNMAYQIDSLFDWSQLDSDNFSAVRVQSVSVSIFDK